MLAYISDRTIKKLQKLEPPAKSYDVRDTSIKGFMVRVYPSGRMIYKYEYARGKRKTIGDAAGLNAEKAREKVKDLIKLVVDGNDLSNLAGAAKYGGKIITFKTFFDNEYKPWLEVNKPDTHKPVIKRLENRFMKLLGDLPLTEITPYVIEKWRVDRLNKDGVQRITANKEIIMLKAELSKAKKWKFVKTHPLEDFEMGELGDNQRERYLTPDEYKRLMDALAEREEKAKACRDDINKKRLDSNKPLLLDLRQQTFIDSLMPKVVLSLGSGIRQCELKRMRRHLHIDFQKQGLNLTPDITKAKKARYVPLDDKTWQVLMDWLEQTKEQYPDDALVFPGVDAHTQFDNVTKAWKNLMKLAEIDNFTWHDMRHDYASQLVMSGVDLNTVRELLGHADIKMTLRYAHLAPEHKKGAVVSLQQRRESMM